MKDFMPGELNIPYGVMTMLRDRGVLVLGLDKDAAWDVVREKLAPRRVCASYHFWDKFSVFVLLGSFAATFFIWWLFFLGIILASLIVSAANRSNVTNVIKAATRDPSLYTHLSLKGRWKYRISEDVIDEVLAEKYATGNYSASHSL